MTHTATVLLTQACVKTSSSCSIGQGSAECRGMAHGEHGDVSALGTSVAREMKGRKSHTSCDVIDTMALETSERAIATILHHFAPFM
jgi:hypothetical protein